MLDAETYTTNISDADAHRPPVWSLEYKAKVSEPAALCRSPSRLRLLSPAECVRHARPDAHGLAPAQQAHGNRRPGVRAVQTVSCAHTTYLSRTDQEACPVCSYYYRRDPGSCDNACRASWLCKMRRADVNIPCGGKAADCFGLKKLNMSLWRQATQSEIDKTNQICKP